MACINTANAASVAVPGHELVRNCHTLALRIDGKNALANTKTLQYNAGAFLHFICAWHAHTLPQTHDTENVGDIK